MQGCSFVVREWEVERDWRELRDRFKSLTMAHYLSSCLFVSVGWFALCLLVAPAIAQTFARACEKLVMPSPPTDKNKTFIRKGFGEYGAPRKGSESSHLGVDITRNTSDADSEATAVYSVSAGTVVYSQINGSETDGYGNVVVVDHGNGCYSLYAHLAGKPITPRKRGGNMFVARGASVVAGQKIGYFVDIKSDTSSTGNAVRTDSAAREQMHFAFIEAVPGQKNPASIKEIVGPSGAVVDPTAVLKSFGYQLR
jgi:murein DD-endopeptidase MepM/ murein hydrolase activator NlpD